MCTSSLPPGTYFNNGTCYNTCSSTGRNVHGNNTEGTENLVIRKQFATGLSQNNTSNHQSLLAAVKILCEFYEQLWVVLLFSSASYVNKCKVFIRSQSHCVLQSDQKSAFLSDCVAPEIVFYLFNQKYMIFLVKTESIFNFFESVVLDLLSNRNNSSDNLFESFDLNSNSKFVYCKSQKHNERNPSLILCGNSNESAPFSCDTFCKTWQKGASMEAKSAKPTTTAPVTRSSSNSPARLVLEEFTTSCVTERDEAPDLLYSSNSAVASPATSEKSGRSSRSSSATSVTGLTPTSVRATRSSKDGSNANLSLLGNININTNNNTINPESLLGIRQSRTLSKVHTSAVLDSLSASNSPSRPFTPDRPIGGTKGAPDQQTGGTKSTPDRSGAGTKGTPERSGGVVKGTLDRSWSGIRGTPDRPGAGIKGTTNPLTVKRKRESSTGSPGATATSPAAMLRKKKAASADTTSADAPVPVLAPVIDTAPAVVTFAVASASVSAEGIAAPTAAAAATSEGTDQVSFVQYSVTFAHSF